MLPSTLSNRAARAASFLVLVVAASLPGAQLAWALGQEQYVQFSPVRGGFTLVDANTTAKIYVDPKDWPGVLRAANDLSNDIRDVTGRTPKVISGGELTGRNVIIIGTIGKSEIIDRLIAAGKIDVSATKGKWESYFTQVVRNPLPGVDSALVICGSDKRGTIYGIYDLSEESGQSPWYYWADVPAKKHAELYIKAGKFSVGEPSVKYRGIFFNDEAPSLSGYIHAKYGDIPPNNDPSKGPIIPAGVANYGHEFYSHVFELLLRCKGNFLWPAMWNNAFNEDDPANAATADMYGIVMGTSHQEPMLRAQKEWDRLPRSVTGGPWNYATHPDTLEKFWREGLVRNKGFESILTIGLRGENDSEMVRGTDQAIDLLNKIIPAQRKIIAETVNPDLTKVPQVWALYKEVQNYYDTGGLHPPDDVTLLWAEDNNGNIRRLPTEEERKRSGGAGIYYHFDYHGGPTDYRWVNTSPIPRIWDQMSLAKEYGADRIWVVNVGKFKNIEFATDYWLNLGWNFNRWTNDSMREYTRLWATREFGPECAGEIADIMTLYTKYNGRRKPERLTASTYSAVDYSEAERVAADYNALATRAEAVSKLLPKEEQDAFYELVLFPVTAGANLNEMYMAGARNALYAQQGRVSANDFADMARRDYARDAELMKYFNTAFAGGKWDHFQDDVHIGYTSWPEPRTPTMDQIHLTEVPATNPPTLGVAVENSAAAWPGGEGEPLLPRFNSIAQQRRFIDVFNRGKGTVQYTVTPSDSWIIASASKGSVAKDERIWISIDWSKVPKGAVSGSIRIAGGDETVVVKVDAVSAPDITRGTLTGFVEDDGLVSIEPEHYTGKTDQGELKWIRVQDYGRTLSAMRVQGPVNFGPLEPAKGAPHLEYKTYFFTAGEASLYSILAPNLAFIPGRDLHFAVSIDDQKPIMVTGVPTTVVASGTSWNGSDWEKNVKDEARTVSAKVQIPTAGYHTLKVWMVDPGITVQKIIIDLGGLKPSYLGPPESYNSLSSSHDKASQR
ncbi:glycosyl hydrolase 115 family protein [Terracidiphilus gabretensis]|uniref:glycosyl hydrolase 115 family protein n=1 Tax=Terracidiphilus gabretensis TaxID=1577687 RepID=UPI00071BF50C|nr:glycosyl hydrolase 115 family protein [Terracidiphilus gabretensis]